MCIGLLIQNNFIKSSLTKSEVKFFPLRFNILLYPIQRVKVTFTLYFMLQPGQYGKSSFFFSQVVQSIPVVHNKHKLKAAPTSCKQSGRGNPGKARLLKMWLILWQPFLWIPRNSSVFQKWQKERVIEGHSQEHVGWVSYSALTQVKFPLSQWCFPGGMLPSSRHC